MKPATIPPVQAEAPATFAAATHPFIVQARIPAADVLPLIPHDATLSAASSVHSSNRGKVPGTYKGGGTWTGMAGSWAAMGLTPRQQQAAATWPTPNVGLRAASFPAVDIDVASTGARDLIEALAAEHLGPAPVRERDGAPRSLLVYRLAGEEPIVKANLKFTLDGEAHALDVLGLGQQYAVAGVHPSGHPYTWREGHGLAEWGVDGLTSVTAPQIADFLAAAEAAILAAGGAITSLRSSRARAGEGVAVADLDPALDPALAVAALRAVPNTPEHLPGREDFLTTLASFKAALGREAEAHRADAHDWATAEGWADSDYFDKVWDSLTHVRVRPDLLIRRARAAGWHGDAAADFAEPVNDNDAEVMRALSRPTLVQGADLSTMLDVMDRSLAERATTVEVFQRGTVTTVRTRRTRDRLGNEVAQPAFRAVTPPNLIDLASRHFRVVVPGKGGEERPAALTKQAADAYLQRDEWRLPTVGGIALTPVLTRDGRILSKPGFDPQSGVYVAAPVPGLVVPSADAWGSEADARSAGRAALNELAGLLVHYRFSTPAHRSVALAALLTPFTLHAGVRPPLIAFDGTGPGVGKSKLVDAVATIATGARAPALNYGDDKREFEKHLQGEVIAGASILNIDNVERPLEGAVLNTFLTQDRLSIRPLGTSNTVTTEQVPLLLATGNNLVVGGDMVRRVLVARIDPGVERPELQAFPFDPAERAREHRAALVQAALTVLLAHAHCGFPGERLLKTPFGSFEDWSRFVRAALVWLGEPDPIEVAEAIRAADPVLSRLGAVLDAAAAVIGPGVPFAARDLLTAGERREEWQEGADDAPLLAALRDALQEDRRGTPKPLTPADAASAGRYLKRHCGRVVGGLRLEQAGGSAKRGLLYSVERA